MATEGLDIGILMGSKSQEIFMEQVDLYPGARHFYEVVASMECDCGREQCPRECMQFVLNNASGGERGAAAEFINEVLSINTPEELKSLLHDKVHARYVKEEEEKPIRVGDFRRYLDEPFLSLVAESVMGQLTPADNLGDDEPEHSGPQEE